MEKPTFWQMLKETYTQWSEDKPFQLAAALAYYTLFSLAPLLLIAITIAGPDILPHLFDILAYHLLRIA